ncbi:putative ester cyclase [Streptomyces sp. 1114.5]|uniref:ester cyclase n=1 Tax=Streptomyces sp. 1114.5 TaxID=1938830 RepID=UPI000F277FA4|nr:ester cyclase [Streptomyces sp. 1114.5]RKT18973.1 putative ester cyclase [Streptomyces sp. 1114.5]
MSEPRPGTAAATTTTASSATRRRLAPRTAAVAAALTVLLGTTAAAAPAHSPAHSPTHHPDPQPWPQRLVDRSPDLVQPKALTVDRSLGARRAAQEVHLAQQLYTFWNTGQQRYLDAAISPAFRDNTLPPGRPQGPTGPVLASRTFRAAVPDLTCELSEALVTGDRITARLVFRGHFTGTFDGVRGSGQRIEFNAIDIQHVGTDRIVEDWHIEDNTALLSQLGVTG